MTVFFPLLLLICTLSTVRLEINSDSKIIPLLNRGMETAQTSDPEQTCKPDINSVLREMSALLAELKAEIRHLQKENEGTVVCNGTRNHCFNSLNYVLLLIFFFFFSTGS